MKFEVGETVVYPHHGAAEIIEVAEKTIRGETKTYLQLRVTQGELTIWVPKDNVQEVGVRDVIDKKGVQQVFDVLRAEFTEEPTNYQPIG
jgi:CarD family transcriptional regulator